jgi:Kef-type K+ transport system membrane component KefB
VLSPVCAEYVAAYDETTGDVTALLSGLLFFIPLYGCPALLIREVARRTDMTWVGLVSLATALGIVQAGLIDQSLFRLSYRGIPDWASWATPTYIESMGFSAYLALIFVMGHVIGSFCAPIAVTESLVPEHRSERWLGPVGLGVATGLYLTAAGLILNDHLVSESAAISLTQTIVTSLIVVGLVVFAATVGRMRRETLARWCPPALLLFVVVGAVGVAKEQLPLTWPGVAIHAALLVAVGLAALWFARSTSWTRLHELAIAAGFLTGLAVTGFTSEPLFGGVTTLEKYGHNTVLAAAIAVLVLVGVRRSQSAVESVPQSS